jgi:integral membrane sensor domain MASE1
VVVVVRDRGAVAGAQVLLQRGCRELVFRPSAAAVAAAVLHLLEVVAGRRLGEELRRERPRVEQLEEVLAVVMGVVHSLHAPPDLAAGAPEERECKR